MAPARDCQVVRHLPDVMAKSPGIALACAILGNPDPAKSQQTQWLTRDKEQAGLHVKQGPAELVAIGAVKSEGRCVENPRRENSRFPQRDVLGLREGVHSKGWILGRIVQNGLREGVSHKEGIGIRKVVVHSTCRVVFVDRLLGIAKELSRAIPEVSAVG